MKPEPENPPAPAPPDPPKARAPYRPKGKIANLPKPQRDALNRMLLDGNTYAKVVRKMAAQDVSLNVVNVSNWHNGPGYQRWLQDQEWLEEMRADQECGLDVLPQVDAGKFNESALQVAITQLFRALRHVGSGQFKVGLGGDPQGFARVVNALARACRESVNLKKYQDTISRAAAAELKHLDPKRKLTDSERDLFAAKVEELFHVKLPRMGAVQGPSANGQNPQTTEANEQGPKNDQ